MRTSSLYLSLSLAGAVAGFVVVRAATGHAQGNAIAQASALPAAALSQPSGEAAASSAPASQATTLPSVATVMPTTRPSGVTLAEEGCPVAVQPMPPAQDAFLQERMENLLSDYKVPEGAIVLLDPRSGALLAAAGIRAGVLDRRLAFAPGYAAASVFKLVTAAALLEHGTAADASTCFHGGKRRLYAKDLKDSRRDGRCATLSEAVAKSLNVPMAKFATRSLSADALLSTARTLGFNVGDQDAGAACFGSARPPHDELEFGRTAAGFGDVKLSAWHGALLTATIANRGLMPTPAGRVPARLIEEGAARALGQMMVRTVTEGTAKRGFTERGRNVMGSVQVAGKTGSLAVADARPYREVTWFVGYAPADDPQVAVAAVVDNGPRWRIRATYAGREALRTALLRTSPYRPTQDRAAAGHKAAAQ